MLTLQCSRHSSVSGKQCDRPATAVWVLVTGPTIKYTARCSFCRVMDRNQLATLGTPTFEATGGERVRRPRKPRKAFILDPNKNACSR